MTKTLRESQVTLKVNTKLLIMAKNKLDQENEEGYARAKNKHYATKKSIADIFENALIDYINN